MFLLPFLRSKPLAFRKCTSLSITRGANISMPILGTDNRTHEIEPMKLNFKNLNILVVGDLSLDVAIEGIVERISPEAPVPVVLQEKRKVALGCAGNVAAALRALGAQVTLVGVVGVDSAAKELVTFCKEKGVVCRFVADDERPTITKTRIFARHSQLLRVDREEARLIAPVVERQVIEKIAKVKNPDFIIVSDYRKGTLTPRVMKALHQFGKEKIVADFKPQNAELFQGIFAIVPNLKEAHELTGLVGAEKKTAEKIAK